MASSHKIWRQLQDKLPANYDNWLDILAIIAWGFLLLKYWITGKLGVLIHPNYFILTVIAGLGLLVIGASKFWDIYQENQRLKVTKLSVVNNSQEMKHITLFNPIFSSMLLLITALLAIVITPKTFASQTALERGLTESLPVTRTIQSFKSSTKPEDRSLIDWIKTLNVYPEPDAYTGQKVKVQGFTVYPPNLSEQYIWLARFVITCCAADAYPIGLPVKLQEGKRTLYPIDGWLEIEGNMITEEIDGKRKLVIAPAIIKPIPEPKNPYDY